MEGSVFIFFIYLTVFSAFSTTFTIHKKKSHYIPLCECFMLNVAKSCDVHKIKTSKLAVCKWSKHVWYPHHQKTTFLNRFLKKSLLQKLNIIKHFLKQIPIIQYKTWNSAEMRALSQITPQKSDTQSRSQPSSVKVSRRSRSKSPFRSFRWKRSSAIKLDSDDEGIFYLISFFYCF